jgi:hypothetical protein
MNYRYTISSERGPYIKKQKCLKINSNDMKENLVVGPGKWHDTKTGWLSVTAGHKITLTLNGKA